MNHSLKIIVIIFILLNFQDVHCYTESEKWGYSLCISISMGLLGFLCSGLVIIFKNSKKVNINVFLPALIALAAGSLIGDAVVHLIPHSFE